MSALILKRTHWSRISSTYVIIRQDEKLREMYWENHGDWEFFSQSFPSIYDTDGRFVVCIRGDSKYRDMDPLIVASKNVYSFEEAVLAFNIAHGNNKDLEISDVIWDVNET